MKTTFGSIVALGILVAGISGVAHAGDYYGCRPSKTVVVTEPTCVQHNNSYSYYRYYTYPRYQSWRYGYAKAKGWYGTGYRYRYYRCR